MHLVQPYWLARQETTQHVPVGLHMRKAVAGVQSDIHRRPGAFADSTFTRAAEITDSRPRCARDRRESPIRAHASHDMPSST